MFKGIDLFSDTVTRPTAAMKNAMLEAEVGDEQKREDPTTYKLEEMVAELLGHDAAMFFPSATMANEIAIRLLTEPGDELIGAENCHLFVAEAGAPAVHSGVMTRAIRTESGIFSADELRKTYRTAHGPHYPRSKMLSIENTTNLGGGIAWQNDAIHSVLQAAKELKLKTHLDGSRLFNAAVKTGTPSAKIASQFDAVTLCLSKGLGCPVGAMLAFNKNDYEKVRRLKQLWGGAMRQTGILAAAGIYALKHHIERLADDHSNAAHFAKEVAKLPQFLIENKLPSTNMVFFSWQGKNMSPSQFLEACLAKGLRFSQVDENRFRAVTHLDVSKGDIDKAIEILKQL